MGKVRVISWDIYITCKFYFFLILSSSLEFFLFCPISLLLFTHTWGEDWPPNTERESHCLEVALLLLKMCPLLEVWLLLVMLLLPKMFLLLGGLLLPEGLLMPAVLLLLLVWLLLEGMLLLEAFWFCCDCACWMCCCCCWKRCNSLWYLCVAADEGAAAAGGVVLLLLLEVLWICIIRRSCSLFRCCCGSIDCTWRCCCSFGNLGVTAAESASAAVGVEVLLLL